MSHSVYCPEGIRAIEILFQTRPSAPIGLNLTCNSQAILHYYEYHNRIVFHSSLISRILPAGIKNRIEKVKQILTIIFLALAQLLPVACANYSEDPMLTGILLFTQGITSDSTDNNPGIILSQSGGATTLTESSGYDFYSLKLSREPTEDVYINIAFDNSQITLNGQSTSPRQFTFTSSNWATMQTMILRAVDDSIIEGNHTSSLTHTVISSDANYNAINVDSINAFIIDNDSSGISLSESGGSTILTESSSSDSYDIVLTQAPTATVTVNIEFDTAQVTVNGAGVSPVQITYTTGNWYTPQMITLVALNDGLLEGPHTSSISHNSSSVDTNYNAIIIASISASISDANGPGVSLIESSGSTTISEGSINDSYTLVLTSAPTDDVLISIIFDSSQLTVNGSSSSPQILTFTNVNWATLQTITLAAVDDSNIEGTHSSFISHTVSSIDSSYHAISTSGIAISIIDDDITPLVAGGVQTGLTSTTATSTIVSITTVDMSKSFVMCYFTASSSQIRNVPTCQLTASNQVTIAKGGGSVSLNVRHYVMEFASGISVQRGSSNLITTANTGNVTLSTAVDLSKSFVIAYARTSTTGTTNDEQRLIKAKLTSPTNLQFTRSESGAALDIEWQVVQLDGAQVQSGTAIIGNGNTSTIAPLGAFDSDSAFLIFNFAAGNVAGVESNYLINGNISSTTSLTFTRQGTNQQLDIAYYLVEMVNGPNIQRGTINVNSTSISATASLSPVINTLFTMPIINFNLSSADSGSIDSGYFRPELTASNLLTVHRNKHENRTCTVDWYTIELTSE